MQSTSPIRRYVILRRRDHGSDVARWSMERVVPEHASAATASSAPAQPVAAEPARA